MAHSFAPFAIEWGKTWSRSAMNDSSEVERGCSVLPTLFIPNSSAKNADEWVTRRYKGDEKIR